MAGPFITPVAKSVPFDNELNDYLADNVQEAIEYAGAGNALLNCQHKIYVAKNGNDTSGDGGAHNPYLTICQAMAQITDNDSNNGYVILVGPGIFVEDTITMKQYVTIMGEDAQVTVISVDTPTKKVIVGSVSSSIVNVTISSASGIGGVGIFCENVTGTYGEPFITHNCIFLDNETHMKIDGASGTIGFQANFCRLDPSFTNGLVATTANGNDACLYLSNLSLFHRGLSVGDFLYLAGSGTKAFLGSVSCTNTSNSGVGIRMRDGAKLVATSSALEGFDKGIWIEDVGANCSIYGDFKLIDNVTYDIQIDQAGAWGNITGVARRTRILNLALQGMTLDYADPVTGDFNVSRILATRGLATDILCLTTSTTPLSLSSTDEHAISVTGDIDGTIIELPDATTLRGGHQFWIINNSTKQVTTRRYDGSEPVVLNSGASIKYIVKDISTSAGIWSRAITSSSPFSGTAPVLCYYGGNAAAGRYLEIFPSAASNEAPYLVPVPLNLIAITIQTDALNTASFGIYTLADLVNPIATISLSNQDENSITTLNIPIPADAKLAVKTISGSATKPKLAFYLTGGA